MHLENFKSRLKFRTKLARLEWEPFVKEGVAGHCRARLCASDPQRHSSQARESSRSGQAGALSATVGLTGSWKSTRGEAHRPFNSFPLRSHTLKGILFREHNILRFHKRHTAELPQVFLCHSPLSSCNSILGDMFGAIVVKAPTPSSGRGYSSGGC